MPYQLNGQLVTIKSHRPLHATRVVTAVGGSTFVTMSADIAALGGAAMSNAATPTMQREVRLMVIAIWRQLTLNGEHSHSVSRLREDSKLIFAFLFRELLQLSHNEVHLEDRAKRRVCLR